jgi:hypothetical protein
MALQGDSPECAGTYNEKWFKFVAVSNAIRIGLSGASSGDDNKIALYNNPSVGYVSPLVPIAVENDVNLLSAGVVDQGDETLLVDNLVIGQTYYCVIATIAGTPGNVQVRFNSLMASECENDIFTSGTNTFNNTCQNFKCKFRPNAQGAVVNRWSTNSISAIPAWTYTIPSTTSMVTICQVGKLVAANMTGGLQTIYVTVDVKYNLPDAAGNISNLTAISNTICSFNLNSEVDLHVRSTDQCPVFKSTTASIATDRSVCGANSYQWKFTQASPTIGLPLIVNGGMGTRILAMSAIPGITNGQRYDVKLRAAHLDLVSYTSWTITNDCVKTIGAAGMPLNTNESITDIERKWQLYPNPSLNGDVSIVTNQEGIVTYELYNQLGAMVSKGQWYVQSGMPVQEHWDVRKGLYHLRLNNGSEISTLSWVKQ